MQHYSWGGFHYIPELFGIENNEQKSFAEYWMGDHPSQSSYIVFGEEDVVLSDFIKKNGEKVLGANDFATFGGLPYLFKILDVRRMLSIQVHPSKEEARFGFEREEAEGIPLGAANRNYKDQNHKPEMMVALSDFWLLHGFKSEAKILETLSTVQEISFLKDVFFKGGLKSLFAHVMELEQAEVDKRLQLLSDRILPLYDQNKLEKSSEDFWAARAIKSFCASRSYDRGIFCIYLFNLLHLKSGEGVFQPAGMPHAYLEGQNVEIMANSDNVLRAGLTDKHIDVPELLKHTVCEPTVPNILKETGNETFYPSPAAEFVLYKYQLSANAVSVRTKSAEIIIVLEGSIQLVASGEEVELKKGDAALLIAGTDAVVKADTNALFFRAASGVA